MSSKTREATCKIMEMMDEGILDPKAVAEECLRYMSEYDVADMAHVCGWLEEEEYPDDEEEED
jgi:hypothetical protein